MRCSPNRSPSDSPAGKKQHPLDRAAAMLRGEDGPAAQAAAEEALKNINKDRFASPRQDMEQHESSIDAMQPAAQAKVAELESITGGHGLTPEQREADCARVKAILSGGISPDVRVAYGETLLSRAMMYDSGHAPQMMRVVLEAGANANARNMMDDAHPLENEYLVGLVELYVEPEDRTYDLDERDKFYNEKVARLLFHGAKGVTGPDGKTVIPPSAWGHEEDDEEEEEEEGSTGFLPQKYGVSPSNIFVGGGGGRRGRRGRRGRG